MVKILERPLGVCYFSKPTSLSSLTHNSIIICYSGDQIASETPSQHISNIKFGGGL